MFKKLLFVFCLLTAAQLPALQMGRYGKPFEKSGITWQPVRYIDNGDRVYAALPGSPASTISETGMTIHSEYEGTKYEVQIYTIGVPKTPKALIAYAQTTPGTKAWEVKTTQRKCSYTIAYERKEKGKIIAAGRVFVTPKGAYNFIAIGKTDRLNDVLKSVKIK